MAYRSWIIDCFVLAFFIVGTVYPACQPVKEGTDAEIDCTVDINGQTACFDTQPLLTWSLDDGAGGEVAAAYCNATSCTPQSAIFTATIIPMSNTQYSSSLTVHAVNRSIDNILNEWFCTTAAECGGSRVSACQSLEVYYLPEAPTCSLNEVTVDGELTAVQVVCSTTKVYPVADCIFYHYKDSVQQTDVFLVDGNLISANGDPVYLNYGCELSYNLTALFDGTHTFKVLMYPRIDSGGGPSLPGLVNTTVPGYVALVLPAASLVCTPEQTQGYFKGKSATCICSLTDEGYPRGTPQWYDKDGDELTTTSDGSITFVYDSNNLNDEYICKGKSVLGESQGSTVSPQFAFLDDSSVEVYISPTNFSLCPNSSSNNNNNSQVITVTCRVATTSASPGVTFSYSLRGNFAAPQLATQDRNYHQTQFTFDPEQGGGVNQVTCRAENSVFTDLIEDSLPFYVSVYEPPSDAPTITIQGQTYQETSQNATVIEGFTGDITCEVKGGYPTAYNTRLACGSKVMIGAADSSVLTFQSDPLTRDMDGTVCSCTAQHVSGCYDLVTSLTIDVQYLPNAALTSGQTEFDEGQSITLSCLLDGNPPPSVTLSKARTGEILAQSYLGDDRVEHTSTNITCLDTDTYVCTASNVVGTVTSSVEIFVRCEPHLAVTESQNRLVYVAVGDSREFSVEIYGYPRPAGLVMTRVISGRIESAPARHTVQHKYSTAPYSSIEVTLTDVTLDDYAIYIITVNSEIGFLEYTFTPNGELSESPEILSEKPINSNTVGNIIDELMVIVTNAEEETITSTDVEFITSIIEGATATGGLGTNTVKDILTIANQVSGFPQSVILEAQSQNNSINRLLSAVDSLGTSLELVDNQMMTVTSGGFGLLVWAEPEWGESVLGIKLTSGGSEDDLTNDEIISVKSGQNITGGGPDVAIQLPDDLLRTYRNQNSSYSTSPSVRLVFNVYTETTLYRYGEINQTTNDSLVLGTYIIGAQLLIDNAPVTDLGNTKVRTVFRRLEEDRPVENITCVYWEFTANSDTGGWRDEGCSLSDIVNYSQYHCECDHLTNFAVLVNFRDQKDLKHNTILGWITIIGLSVAIVCLTFTIMSFLCITKLRKTESQQVVFQLSLALILSWIVFLFGIERTSNESICLAVAGLLHYLILASFTWTLVQAAVLYRLLVKIRDSLPPRFILKASLAAWATPAVIVVIVGAVDYRYYKGGQDFCWMDTERDGFFYGFAIPVGVILVINFVVFVLITFSLCTRRDMSAHSSIQANQTVVNIRASFFSFVTLGLTWIFGFLAIEDAQLVFQYLFCSLVALQGIVVAVMTFRDQKVRQYWKNYVPGPETPTADTSHERSGHYEAPRRQHNNYDTSHERSGHYEAPRRQHNNYDTSHERSGHNEAPRRQHNNYDTSHERSGLYKAPRRQHNDYLHSYFNSHLFHGGIASMME